MDAIKTFLNDKSKQVCPLTFFYAIKKKETPADNQSPGGDV
jgi:hypothetical protein